MSKKIMLLALTAVSAAMFALPAVASAGSPQIDVTGTNFPVNITGHGAAGSLSAEGEPTITCETTDITGSLTSSTAGNLEFDFTGCHIVVLGLTIKCRSAGSALDNTITTKGTFTSAYLTDDKTKPGIAVTPETTTVQCGTARIKVTGTVLGTILKPECAPGDNEDASWTFSFTKTAGGVQTHRHTTGTGATHTLIAHTENSAGEVTKTVHGALEAHATVSFGGGAEATLTCV